MSELLYTWTPAQFLARRILINHQRLSIGSCTCGWGVDTGDLGRSHADHVVNEMIRDGVFAPKASKDRACACERHEYESCSLCQGRPYGSK